MKRLLLTFLILVMVFSVAACDSNKSEITSDKTTGVPDATTAPDETNGPSEKPEESKKPTPPVTADNNVSLEERIIVDQNGVLITLEGLDFSDAYYAGKVKILIENNTEKNINVRIWAIAVNDIMVDGDLNATVATGKNSNESITFDKDNFAAAGIEVIQTIDVVFDVYDTDTYTDIFVSELVSLTTTGSEGYVQKYSGEGQLVFDQGDVNLVAREVVEYEDSYIGAAVVYYVENNSANHISITARDTSVNGFMVDAGLYTKVLAGKRAYTSMEFYAEDLTESDIEAITDIEASYSVFNPDTSDDYFVVNNVKTTF